LNRPVDDRAIYDPSMEPGSGIPGWFVAWGVFVVVVGVVVTIWRVSTAQKLAKRSGMDPGLATQMTLLSDDGLDATYLASSLRQQTAATPAPATAPAPTTTSARLAELKSLLDAGLVTQAEYDERRKAIIDSV
jgi:membrane protease subunit (stomatin/prohibitin family)